MNKTEAHAAALADQGLVLLTGCVLAIGALSLLIGLPAQARAALWRGYVDRAAAFTAGVRARTRAEYWRRLQHEVLAELRNQVGMPPRPAGVGPNPQSAHVPLFLYHGTARRNMASVFLRGIEPRSGGRAFLGENYETALSYGRSRGGTDFAIFRVMAQELWSRGEVFERRNGYYVTASAVHPDFIDWHYTIDDLVSRQNP